MISHMKQITSAILVLSTLSACQTLRLSNVFGERKSTPETTEQTYTMAQPTKPGDSDNTARKETVAAVTMEPISTPSIPPTNQIYSVPQMPSVPKNRTQDIEAVRGASQHATVKPESDHFVNAMTVYDYSEGALYTVYAAPAKITDIVFQPGERVVSFGAGDTLRWQVGQTHSGQGDLRRDHLLVKPNNAGFSTALVVTTDRRSYHMVLKALDETYMASVRWTYPNDDFIIRKKAAEEARKEAEPQAGLNFSKLRFAYDWKLTSGTRPSWTPALIFDDGRKVYIRFGPEFSAREAPVLFVADNADRQIVNYRLVDNHYIVDRLFSQAKLVIGQKDQTEIEIRATYETER